MKLYEINQEIERLTNVVEYDPERAAFIDTDTGEILTEEELDGLFEQLQMDKHEILTWLAKEVLNLRADIDAYKAEEKRLKDRRVRLEKKAERFLRIIDRECNGETTDFGVATMKYITTHPVEIENEAAALSYLGQTHPECLKVTTEISKTEVKKLIQKGWAIPGIELLDKRSGSLK